MSNRTLPDALHHPRQEAQQGVGAGRFARVLEPSPPAVDDGDFFADDPVKAEAPAGSAVVSPVPGPDVGCTWEEWLAEAGHEAHAGWAADRWLGAYRRLPPAPATLANTRLALHRLAVYVISPARRRANTKIGLRFTRGGFGTPFFRKASQGPGSGEDEQVRVAGATLVHQFGGGARQSGRGATGAITTLTAAAKHILDGPPDVEWAKDFDVPPLGDPDEDLGVDPAAAAFLGDWYGFAWSVLEELRSDAQSTDTGRVQLWPEHFDAAFDCLPEARRVTFGASPGDAAIAEPYLYVLPWHFDELPGSDLWNATTFRGAILPFSDLVDAPQQRGAALAFMRARRAAIGS
ncbi:MAG TPA: hypothetical protein VGL92_13115 [Acidimicrobiia bacterium]